ncbi:efflux RND transporter periplasmic adaptor subunit [Salinisphaera sp.]|uniref:efflux RND transporter periplasmic adaptor subunit n=1 Tax=Salinisphaera sp. TaxID=1914330 RepID=UPI002D767AF9|nr:efflux RND transporter periplasmic adaptor subunit [Salinisphaera sp.]HET7313464.1 efflux RND transporter periplasmic adaptor subunit [Salinisphaera sp.]
MTRAITGLALLCVASAVFAAGQPSVRVRTAPVKRQQMAETITALGQIRPDPQSQIAIGATYAAFVQQLDVTLGQSVCAGEALLTLRTAPAARANYLSAKARVHYARESLARKRKLLEQHLATHADVNAAEQALATAKAAFAAQKALGTGEKTRVIKAPFTGIVSKLSVQPGVQVQAGNPLLRLAKRDSLEAVLGLEPDESNRVEKGTAVRVEALFADGNGVESRISQVNAAVDPNTRLVNAIVRLDGDRAGAFLPGMRVKGTLVLTRRTTLAVPRSAVLHDRQGDYVFVVRQGKAHRINVATGIENNGLIGVAGKLKAGQPVVVTGNYELSEGMAVRRGDS